MILECNACDRPGAVRFRSLVPGVPRLMHVRCAQGSGRIRGPVGLRFDRPRPEHDDRRHGFKSGTPIAPGGTVTIRTPIMFRNAARHFVCRIERPRDFLIQSLVIGSTELLAGAAPAAVFDPRRRIESVFTEQGMPASITVTNLSGRPARFRAILDFS